MKKRLLSILLVISMLASALSASGCGGETDDASETQSTGTEISEAITTETENSEATAVSTVDYDFGLADNIEDGVILHAWTWSFSSITESMADIAAAGYSAIQTSPINACYAGDAGMQLMGEGKWYYHYQPTDWTIGNYQLGTEEEFIEMCAEAAKYGIQIIVDVVPNHTTTTTDAVSESLINAAGGFDALYHSNGFTDIGSYSDRLQCTTYAVGGLPDVDTENTGFQDYFIAFLNQCIEDGADGFRYDTAKHIGLSDDPQDDDSEENNFWERVTTEITNADSIFNYGEVLQGDGERIEDYIETIGHTTASSYGSTIRSSISSGNLDAETLSDFAVGGSTDVVTWVESHDTYTDGTSSSLTDDELVLGWALIAAQGEGTPLFYDRPYEADSDNMWGSMNRIGAAGSTLYKDSRIAAVNRFRNAMIGEDTTITNINENAVIIERGDKGSVLVNAGSEEISVEITTSLADGSYEDRSGSGETFTVSGGTLTGTLAAGSIAVLYNDGYTEPVSMASVSIETDSFTVYDVAVEITLHCENAASASYTINSFSEEYYAAEAATNLIDCYTPEDPVSFSDGDTVTIDLNSGDSITVSGTSADGYTSNMTYYFTQVYDVASGATIYFAKPSSWDDEIYVYIYNESSSTVIENASWPGKLMTKLSDGTYSYTLTENWTSGLVIFSDSTGTQYPAAMETGMALEAGMTYSVPGEDTPVVGSTDVSSTDDSSSDSSSSDSSSSGDSSSGSSSSGGSSSGGSSSDNSSESGTSPGSTVTFTRPSDWGSTIYAYVYESGGSEQNADWPGVAMTDNGDGTYTYTVSSDFNHPLILFNDGSNQYPGANEAGLEVEDGKTYSVK